LQNAAIALAGEGKPMTLEIVILAGGAGKRMHSSLPKVLHQLAGKTLLEHIVATAHDFASDSRPIVVDGFKGDLVRKTLAQLDVNWVRQEEQLGTGHALLQALPLLQAKSQILVLSGDVPLVSSAALRDLVSATPAGTVGLLTTLVTTPEGFGRIVRDKNHKILRIVEEKDAAEEERLLQEINTGICLVPLHYLKKWLPVLSCKNAQKEYYLTEIIRMAIQENVPVHDVIIDQPEEVLGVNTREQLAALENIYQKNAAKQLMRSGVTLCPCVIQPGLLFAAMSKLVLIPSLMSMLFSKKKLS
jgi:bifunctional UDP-N-acetylglucosamine pyrophosphorylase / glucosamine-1-phosphate N-acetyltransferase